MQHRALEADYDRVPFFQRGENRCLIPNSVVVPDQYSRRVKKAGKATRMMYVGCLVTWKSREP